MDNENEILFVINGMMRSGTIWLTRLFADTLGVASRTLYHDPPYTEVAGDGAVWHFERPGKFIRRLHYFPYEYPYTKATPMIIMVRDPRDVAVSQKKYYNHPTWEGTIEWSLPRWKNFYTAWRDDERMTTLVRYEDVVDFPISTIRETLHCLGFSDVSEDKIAHVYVAHSFSGTNTQELNKQKGEHGRYGAWKDAIPPELVGSIWRDYHEVMESFGYTEC